MGSQGEWEHGFGLGLDPLTPIGRKESPGLALVRDRGLSVYPGSPTRSAYQLEEVLRKPRAFSAPWMTRSGWRAPVTVWCSSVSVQPLRRKELGPKVREYGGEGY